MENVVILYDHLEHFMSIWHNVWQFGTVCRHLVYFSHFGMFEPRKIRQPCIQVLLLLVHSSFLHWQLVISSLLGSLRVVGSNPA
jgi:hypothetical protein